MQQFSNVIMFSVGIVGLPNVGKSTLFKALTKKQVDISNYPFCTIEPNVGVVAVPDERLTGLTKVFKPPKVTPTIIKFIDIAGLVKNAHKGEGLGNQFLAHIREVNLVCQVVRNFESTNVSHVEETINPQRDIETVNFEMIAKDLETIERRLEKAKKQSKSGDKKALEQVLQLEKIKNWLECEKLLRELPDFSEVREFAINELALLTAKPIIYVYNIASSLENKISVPQALGSKPELSLDLKLESELADLSPEEIKELQLPNLQLDQLIRICYDVLKLVTFYTIAGRKELRAWTLDAGSNILEAGGKVHSDFKEKFVKAEVINWQKLIEADSWNTAKEKGWIKIEGRESIVQDGDVIEFKI